MTVKNKSQSGNISPILGEAPSVPTETKICMVDNLADIITTCATFQSDILGGTNLQKVEFLIFILIFAWACCAACDHSGNDFFIQSVVPSLISPQLKLWLPVSA